MTTIRMLALYALERVGYSEMSFQDGQAWVLSRNGRGQSFTRRRKLFHQARGLIVHDQILTGRAGISVKDGVIHRPDSTISFTS